MFTLIPQLKALRCSYRNPVAPRGGGTKMHLGNPPRSVDLILSTARMNEVLEHAPGDQVVRVQAGVKLEDLQGDARVDGRWRLQRHDGGNVQPARVISFFSWSTLAIVRVRRSSPSCD